jgi:acetyltransferase-like isoleucine patch superfamily enzyme
MRGTEDDPVAAAMAASAGGGSAVHAYMDLMIGSRRWSSLLKYELLACWLAGTPGAFGLALRRVLWRHLLHRSGRGVIWGRNIALRHSGKMEIGDGVVIDDYCLLDAQGCGAGEFRIGAGSLISRNCIISGKEGPLEIGPRVNIGTGCTLYACTKLEIGADTMLAAMCYIGGGRYTTRGRLDIPIAAQPEPKLGVTIEEDCWIGAGVIVVDGVRVGRGSVIAAGAVVTRDVAPFSVVAGVPGRLVASRQDQRLPGESPCGSR